VRSISESTGLHRQDIYKIVLKLEKMGLTMKRLEEPIMIEAILVNKALSRLVLIEKKEAKQRFARLEAGLKELIKAIREQQHPRSIAEEKARFILLKTDEQITNASDSIFEKTKKEFALVTNLELITRRMQYFRDHFHKLSKRGAIIRVIIENMGNDDLVKKTIDKIRPNNGGFTAKLLPKNKCIPYRISDNKELFIRRKETTASGLPLVLWTNGDNIVQFYKDNFEKSWGNPRAISIYPVTTLQKEEKIKKGST
jgi:sugar-specific transcriptional regulator TrmB